MSHRACATESTGEGSFAPGASNKEDKGFPCTTVCVRGHIHLYEVFEDTHKTEALDAYLERRGVGTPPPIGRSTRGARSR